MYAALALLMMTAAEDAQLPANPTASNVWGVSLSEVLKVLLDEALELGREYRNELEQAAKTAVDAVVAFDLPVIPDGVENTLDEATRAAGYAAIVAVLDAILGPVD